MASKGSLTGAALRLRADLTAGAVVRALNGVGVDSIVLRGPALADLLYAGDFPRSYGDVDLLIRNADLRRAEKVLSRLGFEDQTVAGVTQGDRPTYAHTWVRATDAAVIDLHFTLWGVQAAPAAAWEAWAPETETLEVGGMNLTVLTPPGRLVVVALHAAAHGAGVPKPLEDLRRALELISYETWEAGAILAARLEATEALAVALRLLPAGRELAERLELPHAASVETLLRASTSPPTALGFEWLARTPGIGAKASFVAHKLFPDVGFMRAWSPLARRGYAGLIAAYVYRLAWLGVRTGPGFFAWLRTRRSPPS